MPHIEQRERDGIDPRREGRRNGGECEGPGELNWVLTEVIIGYLLANGLRYRTCNDIVGALDNAKDEFQRLVQHPYEDKKIAENGNAYPEEVLP
jgi:hypothetical protein